MHPLLRPDHDRAAPVVEAGELRRERRRALVDLDSPDLYGEDQFVDGHGALAPAAVARPNDEGAVHVHVEFAATAPESGRDPPAVHAAPESTAVASDADPRRVRDQVGDAERVPALDVLDGEERAATDEFTPVFPFVEAPRLQPRDPRDRRHQRLQFHRVGRHAHIDLGCVAPGDRHGVRQPGRTRGA